MSSPPAARSLTVPKLLLFSFLAALLGLLFLEGAASLFWLLTDARGYYLSRPVAGGKRAEEYYSEHDPLLGWNHIPGTRIGNFYGPGATVTIIGDGFRGLDPVLVKAPAGGYRVAFLGDSFTFGYGVGDRHSYPFRLQVLNPSVQSVNMGQGGYSVGQSYLWYGQVAGRLKPDLLVFSFIVDDILRMAELRTENGYGMPGFRLEGDKVTVFNQPVPPRIEAGTRMVDTHDAARFLAGHSALARIAAALAGKGGDVRREGQPDLLALTMHIFDEMHRGLRERDRTLALVLLPTARDLPNTDDHNHANERYYHNVSASVRQYAAEKGVPFLDLFPAFASLPPERARNLFLDESYRHYSSAGNDFVARALDAWLGRAVIGYPSPPQGR